MGAIALYIRVQELVAALEEKYGRVAVFFDGDDVQNDFKEPWDVAFVHVHDYSVLTEILDVLDTAPRKASEEHGVAP